MRRYFLFVIPDLTYEKKDLNVPNSDERIIIGRISRMITNTIFLSHSLRKNITIRLFIRNPIPYVIQIESEKIRYLGPDLRSFASLMLKARKFLLKRIEMSSLTKKWYEPNPGLFLKPTNNPFEDLFSSETSSVDILSFTFLSKKENETNFCSTIIDLERIILNQLNKNNVIIYNFDFSDFLSKDIQFIAYENEYEWINVHLDSKLMYPKLVSIINLILDKNE